MHAPIIHTDATRRIHLIRGSFSLSLRHGKLKFIERFLRN